MTIGTLTAALFLLTTGAVVVAIAAAVGHAAPAAQARRRYRLAAAAALLGWLGLTGALAAAGALGDFAALPPGITPVVVGGNLAAAVVAASALGRRLALQVPLAGLIGFQVFRVGVEICLALLYHGGVVPEQMTFEGRNWDILVGLSALPLAWLAARGRLPRPALLAWNVVSLGLLLNIVVISVLSTPSAFRAFPQEPANTFIATAPYVWLPALLVPAALAGHLLVFRYLAAQPAEVGRAEPMASGQA